MDQVLSNRFRLDTNLPVYISGDAATLHGSMVDVLEAVRRAGVQKVAFMADGAPTRPANENPLPHRPQTHPAGNHPFD